MNMKTKPAVWGDLTYCITDHPVTLIVCFPPPLCD